MPKYCASTQADLQEIKKLIPRHFSQMVTFATIQKRIYFYEAICSQTLEIFSVLLFSLQPIVSTPLVWPDRQHAFYF